MSSNASHADGAPSAGGNCQFYDFPIPSAVVEEQAIQLPGAGALADDLTVHGRLCMPQGRTPKTVMLALHGITYTHQYWNVGFEPDRYNFSRYMTDAGYAVFAIDRLGYGESSHPPAQLVTLDSQAATAHQIIGKLREGDVGGHAFERIILVGHSYGSATSWRESAQYNDADAVISTGWANTIQTEPLSRFFTGFYPAQLDDKFADKNLPPGYLTPRPGGRNQNFLYDLSNVAPKMVEYDETVLRDTVTDGEGLTFYNRYGAVPLTYSPDSSDELALPLSDQAKDIEIPTFLVNGANELFFCGLNQKHCNSSQQLQRAESEYFSDKACFRAAVTPHAGHNLNLQRNAPFTYNTIRTFADQVLGPDGRNYEKYVAGCSEFSGANVSEGPGTFGPFGGPE